MLTKKQNKTKKKRRKRKRIIESRCPLGIKNEDFTFAFAVAFEFTIHFIYNV